LCYLQGIKRSRSPSPPPAAHYPSSHYPAQFASTSSYSGGGGGSHGTVKQEPYVAASEYGKIPKTGKCCGRFCFFVFFYLRSIWSSVVCCLTFFFGHLLRYCWSVTLFRDLYMQTTIGDDNFTYFLPYPCSHVQCTLSNLSGWQK